MSDQRQQVLTSALSTVDWKQTLTMRKVYTPRAMISSLSWWSKQTVIQENLIGALAKRGRQSQLRVHIQLRKALRSE